MQSIERMDVRNCLSAAVAMYRMVDEKRNEDITEFEVAYTNEAMINLSKNCLDQEASNFVTMKIPQRDT
jgi:hypothetical protein